MSGTRAITPRSYPHASLISVAQEVVTSGERLKETMWSFGLGSIWLAYFVSYELSFADPAILASVGLIGALCIITLQLSFDAKTEKWSKILLGIALGFLLLGGGILNFHLMEVERSISSNNRRCLAIQKDMLSRNPLREDGPDLFQALSCKPQGEGSVFATKKANL